VCLDEVIEFF